MTAIEQDALYEEILKLRGENESLRKSITEKEKEITDAEDAYEDMHDQFEALQKKTEDYVSNKAYFDQSIIHAQTLKDFVLYVVEECKVSPDNEHVFRCFRNQAVQIVKTIEV